jgi:hypothetical protein
MPQSPVEEMKELARLCMILIFGSLNDIFNCIPRIIRAIMSRRALEGEEEKKVERVARTGR